MTANPITVSPKATGSDAFRWMRLMKLHALPVVDHKGHLVGIMKGEIGSITDGILQLGGHLLSLSTFWGSDRVRHVVQSAFNGRRIFFFTGGAKTDEAAISAGGGFGSIIGRNSFQRKRTAALSLLDQAIRIYRGGML